MRLTNGRTGLAAVIGIVAALLAHGQPAPGVSPPAVRVAGGSGGGSSVGEGPGPTRDGTQVRVASRPAGGGGGGGGSAAAGGGGGGSTGIGSTTTTRTAYSNGGGPGGVARVISYERVQQQLGLSELQRQQIAPILASVSQSEAALRAELQSSRPPPDCEWYEQQQQKEASTRAAVARAGEEILQLLTPAQQTRLRQLCLQAQGADARLKSTSVPRR